MPTVAPGDILLGKYRVERVLGKGGMGVVVAARHADLDELYAIKLMLPGDMDTREAEERFLREARAAARLKSEHVAKVQDVGRLPDGTPFMVMEHLVGTDLKRKVRYDGPFSPEEAVTLVLQACETLREAHGLGIVHRDVKPANIFLTQRPSGAPFVKVLDFGLAKQMAPGGVGLTTTGMVGGSPLYMSPEQIRSTKHVDHRTDIWAMGIVLHELLTGTTPFQEDVMTKVVGRVLQEEPAPPSRLRPEVPAWLDAVVLRCLHKQPEGRFQSMDELMAALQQRPWTGAPAPFVPLSERTSQAAAPGLDGLGPPPSAGSSSSTTAGFGQSASVSRPRLSEVARRNGVFALIAVVALGLGAAVGAAVLVRPTPEQGLASGEQAAAALPPTAVAMPSPAAIPATAAPTVAATPALTAPVPTATSSAKAPVPPPRKPRAPH